MSQSRLRVGHVISGLGLGGAESMLLRLVKGMDCSRFDNVVLSLTNDGPVAAQLERHGVRVINLSMRRGRITPADVIRLFRSIREVAPDLIQTWMYHADLLGGWCGRLGTDAPVIWNIRHSNLEVDKNRFSTLLTSRICALSSAFIPRRIVCGSRAAMAEHARAGYSSSRMVLIPNGFDTNAFHPDRETRKRVRCQLGVTEDSILIGLVARLDPLKDHGTFFSAASELHRFYPNVKFLACGEGMTSDNPMVRNWIRDYPLGDAVLLLGRRDDVPDLTAALDIATLSSSGEGFPNVVGEAMASGVPVVTTDVGDAAWIVDSTGIVVPRQDPRALAEGWRTLIDAGQDGRHRLGLAARQRIESQFALDSMIRCYEKLYEETAQLVRDRRAH
jgi:glycosyltransferase involved in cell wall biosynthesis